MPKKENLKINTSYKIVKKHIKPLEERFPTNNKNLKYVPDILRHRESIEYVKHIKKYK